MNLILRCRILIGRLRKHFEDRAQDRRLLNPEVTTLGRTFVAGVKYSFKLHKGSPARIATYRGYDPDWERHIFIYDDDGTRQPCVFQALITFVQNKKITNLDGTHIELKLNQF